MCNYNSYKMAKELSDKLFKVYRHKQSFDIYIKLFVKIKILKIKMSLKNVFYIILKMLIPTKCLYSYIHI